MARPVTPELYPDVPPLEVIAALVPYLRRLRVLGYLTLVPFIVGVLGSFLPLSTWLLLSGALAVPTIASFVIVAAD